MFNPYTGMVTTTNPEQYRLLAIDPGTSKLGICILTYDCLSGQVGLHMASTIDADKAARTYRTARNAHGNRFARLLALRDALFKLMINFDVHGIASECPYMGRFPQAYAALTECLTSIRGAVYCYDPTLLLHEIDPSTVKMNVNVNGKSGDKNLMTEAVKSLIMSGRILNTGLVNIDHLDEHAIDAIAVGYAHFRRTFQ